MYWVAFTLTTLLSVLCLVIALAAAFEGGRLHGKGEPFYQPQEQEVKRAKASLKLSLLFAALFMGTGIAIVVTS